jgi:hypothetical protein
MKLLVNGEMRRLLRRSPIVRGYRNSSRIVGLRLRRTPALSYSNFSARSASAAIPVFQQARPQDLDVDRTRIEFRRGAPKNFPSAVFHALWHIANTSPSVRPGTCALVSIKDDVSIRKIARDWMEFLPSCSVAFFQGPLDSYFGDFDKVLGAELVLELDAVDWSLGRDQFLTDLTAVVRSMRSS